MPSETESLSHPSSFRDPSGYIYHEKGILYRAIALKATTDYEVFMQKLYPELSKAGMIISHTEVKASSQKEIYKIIKPELVPFISYPYEWSFSQLQDAALLTLRIQLRALEQGLSLKDASAYNIQFLRGKPILIDTLSFEVYSEGQPWVAYRQFCQHFLAPLALASKVDIRLTTLSEKYIDGIPLDLASKLLPGRTRFSLMLGPHIHLHARSQSKHADSHLTTRPTRNMGKNQLIALLHSLESAIRSQHLPQQKTEWGNYYTDTNYSQAGLKDKQDTLRKWIKQTNPKTAWDAGANDGRFSRLASSQGIPTIASDIDPMAVEHAYQQSKQKKDTTLLPLVIDLTNPSPAIGWENKERDSFLSRQKVDFTMALALIHHLAIANNLPLPHIAQFFAKHTKYLAIEFVPKEDSNTKRLLAVREDIFPSYNQDGFEAAFSTRFKILEKKKLKDSVRTFYLMETK